MDPKKQRFLRQNDIIIIVSVITAALFISAYPNPFVAAGLIVLGIITIRLIDAPKGDESEDGEPLQNESASPYADMTPEEILFAKMNDGSLEHAIEKRSQEMIDNITKDLFSNYSDVSNAIRQQLSKTMIEQINNSDYAQYNTQLNMVLENAIANVMGDSQQLLKNIQTMLDTEKITNIKVSTIHQWFERYAKEHADVSDLTIDYSDDPAKYEPLTITTSVKTINTHSKYKMSKNIELTCDQDESLNLTIGIDKWNEDADDQWRIGHIIKHIDHSISYRSLINQFEKQNYHNPLDLQTPMNHLRQLNDLELKLIKLHQDRTNIELDEDILEDLVEPDQQPEAYYL